MAEGGISLQNLIDHFQFSPQQLGQEVSEEHVREVARTIADHELLGLELGLTEAEMAAVNADARTEVLRRMGMLRRWKQKFAFRATYKCLIDALLKCERANDAQKVCRLLTPGVSPEQPAASAGHSSASLQTHHAATSTGHEPTSGSATTRSGKNTPEYQRVLSNLNSITTALQLNPFASQSVRQKFKAKGWLNLAAKPTEEELVMLVLSRIEQDTSQYGEFIAILNDVTGMDQIVKTLTAPPPVAQTSPPPVSMSDSGTKPPLASSGMATARGSVASTSTSSKLPTSELAMEDMVTVRGYLLGLEKEQIRTLGLVLGLHMNTLANKWDSSKNVYLDDVLRAWLLRQDSVEEKGAPSWTTLATALEDQQLGHNGIAAKIRRERLG